MVLPDRGGATIKQRWPRPDRSKQIDDSVGDGLGADFEFEPFLWVDRCEGIERLDVYVVFGFHPFDVEDLANAGSLGASAMLHHCSDLETLSKPEFFDHCSGNEWVGSFARVIVSGGSQESVPIGMHFEHPEEFLARFLLRSLGGLGSGDGVSFFVELGL